MDYNNNETVPGNNPVNNTNNGNYYNSNQPNGMATAALILGILAIISICCVLGAYLFGGIAITLALLSRGKNMKLSTNALIGTILSIVGMVISTLIIFLVFINIVHSYGSFDNFMKEYNSYYDSIYEDNYQYDNDSYDYDNGTSIYNYDDNSDTFHYDYDENSQPDATDLPHVLTIPISYYKIN